MAKKTSRKKGTSVDFSGVEAGGMTVPDGKYLAYPDKVELTEAESSGNEMFKFRWKIVEPEKKKGAVVFDNCVLVPQSLWRLKTILQLFGLEVPDGEMDIDPGDLEGEDNTIMIEITNEKYKGKDQPRITGFGEASDFEASDEEEEEEEEEEEKPAKKGAKKKASKKEEEEEEEEEDEEEDEEEKPSKPDKRVGKGKFKEGSKVTFEDEKGKTVRGTVTEIDGTTARVEDKNGEEWELDVSDLEAA